MANFRIQNNGVISRITQTINLSGGGNSRLLECTSISRTANGPSKASFRVPSAYFDTSRRSLRDRYVQVGINGSGDYQFAGYIDVDSAQASPGGENVTLSATSATGWLHRVYVGQTSFVPDVTYHFRNAIGAPTGLTPAAVLENIFSLMPPKWAARVKLGDISELERATSVHLPAQLSLKLSTFKQAIDTLMAYFGDLCWTERFTGNKTFIDFYRVGGSTRGTFLTTCADYGDPGRANLESIADNQSAADTVNRVIVYGARRKFIISSNTSEALDPHARLQPVWNPALESKVLQNPNVADPNHKDYIGGADYVFRRLRLPPAITGLPEVQISKDLGIYRVVDGEKQMLSVQVWKFPTVLEVDPADEAKAIGVLQTVPRIIKSVNLQLDKFTFTLAKLEDALNVTSLWTDENGLLQKTYAKAVIGITFAFEPKLYVIGDTGASMSSGVKIDLMEDGFVESIQRPDFEYTQYTNLGYPIDGTYEFGCRIFDETQAGTEEAPLGGAWIIISEPTVVNNDALVCDYLAGQMLRSRNVRARELPIGLPFADPGVLIGQTVRVQGIHVDPDRFVISAIGWDLASNTTSISADNAQPPTRFEVANNNGYGKED